MPVRRKPSGRWEATLKQGRVFVAARSFDLKRDADAWLAREKAALDGGLDVRAGRALVRRLLPVWVAGRVSRVAAKTAQTDAELLRLLSPALGALQVASVQPRHLDAWYQTLQSRGLGHASIVRYRASMSSFFGWAIRESYIATNPVVAAPAPRDVGEPSEIWPFTEAELAEAWRAAREIQTTYADAIWVAGWTGLRWGELRALQVRDLQRIPTPAIRVCRSQSEGGQTKPTKDYETRTVPVPDHLLPILEASAAGKSARDLLITGPDGGQLWSGAMRRSLGWNVLGRGRRLHDLRHTAACLWLASGVDASTVQRWMGHQSLRTTQIYVHWLGTTADKASRELLNRAGGVYGVSGGNDGPSDNHVIAPPEMAETASD